MNMYDKLPAGMTLYKLISVKVEGVDVPTDKYTMTVKTGEGEFGAYTTPASIADAIAADGGQQIKIVFNGFKEYVENPQNILIGKKLVVTYSAVVNDDADFGPTGNENEVKYVYSNDPNHDYDGDEPGSNDPTGETPKSKTKTVVTQLKIKKIANNKEDNPLAGAEFTVTGQAFNYVIKTGERFVEDANGTYWLLKDGSYTTTDPATANMNTTQYAEPTSKKFKKEAYEEVQSTPSTYEQVGITGDDGIYQLSGLNPGTYVIEETHAPDGFNKITEKKTLEITWTSEAGFGLSQASIDAGFSMVDNGVIYEITINNNSGTELPSTGGIGTTIFYILGGLLVVGAAIILVSRRKAQD
jgi:fimbrial isopeptide formation D2 family protein/LPXTG-motif cell wall-anchored protein